MGETAVVGRCGGTGGIGVGFSGCLAARCHIYKLSWEWKAQEAVLKLLEL